MLVKQLCQVSTNICHTQGTLKEIWVSVFIVLPKVNKLPAKWLARYTELEPFWFQMDSDDINFVHYIEKMWSTLIGVFLY
jgi:hypothetical protein